MAIAALRTGARGNHIAHPCQSGKGLCLSSHSHAKTCHLGQASGDESRAGIVARTLPIAHAHCNGNNVLQHATELTADHIGIGVSAE